MTRLWHCQGHGGANKGCVHAELEERFWVMKMAQDLEPSLLAWGVEVRYAREGDETIDYSDRAEQARIWGADLAFLHHVNAYRYPPGHPLAGQPHPNADGLLCLALPTDHIGLEVGSAITRAAPKDLLGRKLRTIPTNPYDWTKHAHSVLLEYGRRGVPAVLIEWGFATSPRDRAILMGANHRPALVAAAMAGVGRFLELKHAGGIPEHLV